MAHCLPLIIWSAWSVNYFASIFILLLTRSMLTSHTDWDKDKRDNTALFTMTLLGAGEMIGGGFVGGFRDKFGTKPAFIL